MVLQRARGEDGSHLYFSCPRKCPEQGYIPLGALLYELAELPVALIGPVGCQRALGHAMRDRHGTDGMGCQS